MKMIKINNVISSFTVACIGIQISFVIFVISKLKPHFILLLYTFSRLSELRFIVCIKVTPHHIINVCACPWAGPVLQCLSFINVFCIYFFCYKKVCYFFPLNDRFFSCWGLPRCLLSASCLLLLTFTLFRLVDVIVSGERQPDGQILIFVL